MRGEKRSILWWRGIYSVLVMRRCLHVGVSEIGIRLRLSTIVHYLRFVLSRGRCYVCVNYR